MRTYILSRNLEMIPGMMTADDRVLQLSDATEIVRLLLHGDSGVPDHRHLSIPEVLMWDEYPFALLEYFEAFINACQGLVPVSLIDECRDVAKRSWENFWQPGSHYEIKNPIPLASDRMIASHLANLIATRPATYSKWYPLVEDLSLPFVTDWT